MSRSDHRHLTYNPRNRTQQIELESGCGGGGAEVQKKHSERWTEDLFGRGPQCHFCHVKIPAPWIDKVADKQPSTDKENELLAEHWMDEKSPNSRLGCQVCACRVRTQLIRTDPAARLVSIRLALCGI